MKKKEIIFTPSFNVNEDQCPQPASKFIPEWYRNTDPYVNMNYGARSPFFGAPVGNMTVKRCMPFFDAMTSGYMITLPADIIFVDPEEFSHRVIWGVSYEVVGLHELSQIGGMTLPEGYGEVFKWMFNFTIKTPPGYSCMFMHPNFMYDVPFMTLNGIVDTDKHPIPANFPFFLKNGFMGKVEKGTPICQIIPFKRESWKMKREEFDEKIPSIFDNFHSVIEKSYRNRFWSRKSYK